MHSPRPETTLRPAKDADCAKILRWRNHPTVRRMMFTDHEIQAAEHAAWWQCVSTSGAHRVLIICYGAQECGVVTFTREAQTDCWNWGFYLDPDAFPDGADSLRAWHGMELASLAWAKQALGASEIRCEVFAGNSAVLNMHLRHGLKEYGRYPRQRGIETLEVVQLMRAL